MSGTMLYNSSTIDNLVSELQSYNKSITTEKQNAQDAANNLLSEGWSSGTDNGASATFKQKHDSLMTDLEDLLNTLSKGTQHVQDALSRAQSTDTKVADDFSW
ncbi:hypothetical protein [Nocardia miyunensis]|uniref:hypothetical protein n=1 Tax=Nocardia miyunensis TaxID=282684 RepID=UPI000830B5F4|nr:hypothetical protein [Nocardia miyunensis]